MIIKAKLNHLQISPRKVRLVARMIKNMNTKKAEQQLLYMNKRSAKPLLKLLRSAMANAQHNFDIQKTSDFYVKNIKIDQGPTLKRWRPRAFGRAYTIRKRSSHVLLEIEIKDDRIVKRSKEEISKEIKTEGIADKSSLKKSGGDEKIAKKQGAKMSFFNKDLFSKREQSKNAKRRFFQRKSF